MRPPRCFCLLSPLLALFTAGWVVFRYYSSQEKQFRADLGQAKNDLAAGRLTDARARLRDLAARWPADGETAYYLGRSEKESNEIAAGLAAWGRVPASSRFATRAAVKRAGALLNSGQFSKAEAILEALPRGQGADASEVRQALELVYRFQGGLDDVRRLIVFRAMEHLPARRVSEAERNRIRAWFIGRSGNSQRERTALDDLIAEDPGDTAAWDRLAELALCRGALLLSHGAALS
jgi:hypothetical protein